jgi:hypothetical protein
MADNLTASSASATMHTYLLYNAGTTQSPSWKKVVDIKDFPAMGGSPEQIETTTLSNEVSTFVTGVQSLSTFEFLANYSVNDYIAVKGLQNSAQVYEFALAFGKPVAATGTGAKGNNYGSLGVFMWNGQLSAWLEGGGVNAVREMRLSISATSEVSFSETPLTVTA